MTDRKLLGFQGAASILLLVLLLGACGNISNEGIDATYVARLVASVPTNTPRPTYTPTPTVTSTPTPLPYNLTLNLIGSDGYVLREGQVTIIGKGELPPKLIDSPGLIYWNNFPQKRATLKIVAQGYFPATEKIDLERGDNLLAVRLEPDPSALQIRDKLSRNEKLIFIEDFQNEGETSLEFPDNWQIVEERENPGNLVLQIDQRDAAEFASIYFGPDEIPTNFIVEYKFRWIEKVPFREDEWQSVGFLFGDRYAFEASPIYDGTFQLLDRSSDPWDSLMKTEAYYKKGAWYTIRAEISTNRIKVYLNGSSLAEYKKLELDPFSFDEPAYGLYALPHVFGQIDNIVIKAP